MSLPTAARPPVTDAPKPARIQPRTIRVGVGAAVAIVVLIFLTLATGPLPVAPLDVIATVLGRQPDNEFIVLDLGLPRALLAVVGGLTLGVAGALMQAHTRNPLGTPDIIGFSSGASAGAVVAMVLLHLSGPGVGVAAVLGGLVTAVAAFWLAGGAHRAGYRLIVVGIGLSAVLTAVTAYLLTRAEIAAAIDAQRWLAGSLNDATWPDVVVVSAAAAVVVPLGAVLRRPLVALELGDEAAVGLGVHLGGTQLLVVFTAVLASAATVMAMGPVGFVDLVAPQIAMRLTRRPGPLVITSGLIGGLALLLSDLVAQRAIPDTPVPVGIATGVVGGIYLAWLLARMWRRP